MRDRRSGSRRLRDRWLERQALAARTRTSYRRWVRELAAHLDAGDELKAGDGAYFAFLERQFVTRPEDAELLTPSHHALAGLPLSELFTTNYDALIELAFERWGAPLTVSATPTEFLAARPARPPRHLIKG